MGDERDQLSLESRVTRLDSEVKGLGGQILQQSTLLRESTQQTSIELQRLAERVQKLGVPNWGVVMAALAVMLTVMAGWGNYLVAPLAASTSALTDGLREARNWQLEYMKGNIPSSAKGEIDRVASDLHSFESRMGENEQWIVKGHDRTSEHVDRLEQQRMADLERQLDAALRREK